MKGHFDDHGHPIMREFRERVVRYGTHHCDGPEAAIDVTLAKESDA